MKKIEVDGEGRERRGKKGENPKRRQNKSLKMCSTSQMTSFKAKMKKKLLSVGKDMDLHTLLVEGVTPDSYFRKILRSIC